MDETTLASLETLFLALADKTRLRLLFLMADGAVPVGYLADHLGESQPKISRHLAYLRSAGLVSTRRDGKWVYYDIDDQIGERIDGVLRATLNSMGAHDPGERQPLRRPVIAGPTESNPQADIFLEPYMSDWKPNELEIFLL